MAAILEVAHSTAVVGWVVIDLNEIARWPMRFPEKAVTLHADRVGSISRVSGEMTDDTWIFWNIMVSSSSALQSITVLSLAKCQLTFIVMRVCVCVRVHMQGP